MQEKPSQPLAPMARYLEDIELRGFQADAAQKVAVEKLQKLYEQLLAPQPQPEKKRPSFRRAKPRQKAVTIRGLYLWGGVGRGKTYLVDSFFEALPIAQKQRSHFHRFMRDIHERLHRLGNVPNPLNIIADEIAADVRLLCFDELFVSDITDAMLLGGLFSALFDRGVTLVATSNIPPDLLYKDGLQRERFMPAIAAIKANTEEHELVSDTDYRLRTLQQAELYHSPNDSQALKNLDAYFEQLSPDHGSSGEILRINDRDLSTERLGDGVAWFTFAALCDGPRSQHDYIELARCYQSILLSEVPLLTRDMEDQARRFISAIDEFYDRRVNLIIAAAAPARSLYQGSRLKFEFERTVSRLTEMQSKEYLAAEHRP